MPIPVRVTSLDALPEALRGEYKAGSDGAFYPDLDNVEALPAIQGLKTKNGELLNEKRALSERFKPLESIPTDVLNKVVAHVQAGKPLLDQSTWEQQEKQLKDAFAAEKVPLEGRVKKLDAFLQRTLIENRVMQEAKELAHNPSLLLPFVQSSFKIIETDSGFDVRVVDPATGAERIGDSQGSPMTIRQRIEEMAKLDNYKPLFKATGSSGTIDGDPGSGGPPAGGHGDGVPRTKDGKVDMSRLTDAQKSELVTKHGLDGYRKLVGI